MDKLRILLAEDHETVRAGLKLILNAQDDMEVIAEAEDGRTAVSRTEALRPDVVVMDVSMPELNGLKATELLKASCPQVKIVTLTRHAEGAYMKQLFRAGASGYVLKQSRPAELLHAIRAVSLGGRYLDATMAGKVIDDAQRGVSPRATGQSTAAPLSTREAEVMRLIAWGYSNKEVAEQLQVSVKTVETHKTRAMQKLGMTSRIEIVRYALLNGWLQDS